MSAGDVQGVPVKALEDTGEPALIREAEARGMERAVEVARRHHSKMQINEPLWHDGQDWASDRIAEAIAALADPSGVEALEALRAQERESTMQALASMGQAQEAYEAQLKAEAERDDALARLAAAEGRVGVLESVLAPFAREADAWPEEWPDNADNIGAIAINLTKGDFLKARTALALVTPPSDTGEGRT